MILMISRNHTGHRVGECHQHAKLSTAQVKQMREMNNSGLGYTRLSRIFKCGRSTARDICTYRTRWNG